MTEKLSELAHELDFGMGAIEILVSRLVDIEVEFVQLVDSMDRAACQGEEQHYYNEHFRKLRILTSLVQYTMEDLSRESEKTGKIRDVIFETIANSKGEKKND